jgi:hypothetical protein
MADIYGNINLHGGRISDFKIELLTELPTPTVDQTGRMFIYDQNFYCNINGSHKIFQLTENNNTIRDLFGTEWVNPDMSFNPQRFNQFQTINGLDANSNLFTVLDKLDKSIAENSKKRFVDLEDVVSQELQANGVLLYTGSEVIAIPLSTLISSYANFNISEIDGIDITNELENEVLFYNGTNFINKKLSCIRQVNNPPSSFTITHNLGSKYNLVTLVNQTDQTLSPSDYSITFLDNNRLVVNLNTTVPYVRVLVNSTY